MHDYLAGRFYAGLDLGKKQDKSVVAIVREVDRKILKLVFMKAFKLGLPYPAVEGYLKILCERFEKIIKLCIDETSNIAFVDSVKESLRDYRIEIEGVNLTAPRKADVLGNLKIMMEEERLLFPYDSDLCAEINAERFDVTQRSGQILFSHPSGTHDDRLFALALAAYAYKTRTPRPQMMPVTRSF